MEKIFLYEYDAKGNVTAFWNERAEGIKSVNTEKYKTAYSWDILYSNSYNLLKKRTYWQDEYTKIEEIYSPTIDYKSIYSTTVYVNNVLKARTQFEYNSRGEVITELACKDINLSACGELCL